MRLNKDKYVALVLAVTMSVSLGSVIYTTNQSNIYQEETERVLEIVEIRDLKIKALDDKNKELQATVDTLTKVEEEQDQLIKELGIKVYKLEERAKLPTVSRGASSNTRDLTRPSGVTEERIEEVLKDTKLAGLGKYYIQAERDYGVSAKFLVSLSIEESGWGKSNIANSKNNLFGFQAYTNNTSKALAFNTKGDCILHVGKYIAENYLTEGGKHFNGVTVESIHIKYADNPKWASNILAHMRRF